MRLFVYSRTKEARQAPDIIVSIDPGLKTTGIAILNKVNATVSMSAFEWPDINIAKTYLPHREADEPQDGSVEPERRQAGGESSRDT